MREERFMNILQKVCISEKSNLLSELNRQYVFKVIKDANKPEIKQAVESLFNVKVASVKIINQKPRSKRFGRTQGQLRSWKKAYVKLKEGYEIKLADAAA